MRFSDSLQRYSSLIKTDFHHDPHKEGYGKALKLLQDTTHIDKWELLLDQTQISTRQAGKSGCAWFVHSFRKLDEAISRMTVIRMSLKTVNLELQICPDGLLDYGDGPASYKPHNGPHYIPEKGFCAVLLVDAQNLQRNNHQPWTLQ